eukprot:12521272-Alexandrium_andersonii.AAC.1
MFALRPLLTCNRAPRQNGRVKFSDAPDDTSECEIPDWADFTKSVQDKVEADRAVQRARSGRSADERPWCDQKFSTMLALRNAQEVKQEPRNVRFNGWPFFERGGYRLVVERRQ